MNPQETLTAARTLLTEEIEWTGDLNDDCITGLGKYSAHCEAMDRECWFFSVWRIGGKEDLVHSMAEDMTVPSGEAARKICERYLRVAAVSDLLGVEVEIPNG